jgi:hypothetical protein
MSRVTTPPQQQPYSPTAQIPRDKIAMRAYEKWQKRGCTHGHDLQDWVEAENELRAEAQRSGTGSSYSGSSTPITQRR